MSGGTHLEGGTEYAKLDEGHFGDLWERATSGAGGQKSGRGKEGRGGEGGREALLRGAASSEGQSRS